MRKKFWDHVDNPTDKTKSALTSEELRYAERLKKAKTGKTTPPPDPKAK